MNNHKTILSFACYYLLVATSALKVKKMMLWNYCMVFVRFMRKPHFFIHVTMGTSSERWSKTVIVSIVQQGQCYDRLPK